jgi:hypothetical protein
MENREISIITSIYKSELFLSKYLRRIESFQKKGIKLKLAIEFILIANDISIIEENILWEHQIDNLKTIRVPRETLYASWNRGIREASSEIITFWNVDDIRFPKALLKGIHELRKGVQFVYFSFIIIGTIRLSVFNKKMNFPVPYIKNVMATPYDRKIFMKGCLCGPFFMFHRSVFDKIGPFDETLIVAGDFDWFARAAYMNVTFQGIRTIGGIFFTHSGNLTVTNTKVQADENNTILNRYR